MCWERIQMWHINSICVICWNCKLIAIILFIRCICTSIRSEEVIVNKMDSFEFKCVINSYYTYLTLSYITSQRELSIYRQDAFFINSVISKVNNSDSIIVLGDFNLPYVSWKFIDDYYTCLHCCTFCTGLYLNEFLEKISQWALTKLI